MVEITCITVTYGPTPSLRGTLESLSRQAKNISQSYVVVSQPDENGVGEARQDWLSDVEHIELSSNIGFGLANNFAVEKCDTEYVALINPDVVVTEGWLPPLLDALRNEQVAIAAPPLLDAAGYLGEAGQVIYDDGGTDNILGSPESGVYDEVMFSRNIDYASAACWVMRRDVFLDLGGFDERYAPAYFEDSDLALTAQSQGMVSRLIVDRPVIHQHVGASAPRVALAERARQIFTEKWSSQLVHQPHRPVIGEGISRVRDHLCLERIAFVTGGAMSADQLAHAASKAAQTALAQPRDRVTLFVLDHPSLSALRRQYRSTGLEIVATDRHPNELRLNWATDIRTA